MEFVDSFLFYFEIVQLSSNESDTCNRLFFFQSVLLQLLEDDIERMYNTYTEANFQSNTDFCAYFFVFLFIQILFIDNAFRQ